MMSALVKCDHKFFVHLVNDWKSLYAIMDMVYHFSSHISCYTKYRLSLINTTLFPIIPR